MEVLKKAIYLLFALKTFHRPAGSAQGLSWLQSGASHLFSRLPDMRSTKSRLLFASFLVEGVIQTTTGLVGDKANLNLPTASTFYRGRYGLSPQKVFVLL